MRPEDGVHWLSALHVPWWVAGGWALDLFIDRQSRPHKDLDVGILRRDVLEVIADLPRWEFFEAKGRALTRLDAGRAPRLDVNSLWGRKIGAAQWEIEFMLDEADEAYWVFRREPRIRRTLSTLIRQNAAGIPYLAPEVQLLYKARSMRMQDQADFANVAPKLDEKARAWLRMALEKSEPGHDFLSTLD